MKHVFWIYRCPACRQCWCSMDDEPNPRHVCPRDYPAGGFQIRRFEDPHDHEADIRPLRVAA